MKKYIITILGILAIVWGVCMKRSEEASAVIIGGADGPTSIFLAGRVGSSTASICIGIGIVLILIVLMGAVVRKKKK